MTKRTTGVELEAWVRNKGTNVPADVPELTARLEGLIPPGLGRLTREPGVGSIEFVGDPAETIVRSVAKICGLVQLVKDAGYDIEFGYKSPFPQKGFEPENAKPRYQTLWAAALAEVLKLGGTEEDWKTLGVMNARAATHVHYKFEGAEISADKVDDRIVLVINVLKKYGPRITRILCKKYGVDNAGHLGIWSKWARPERFTGYHDWYTDFTDLKTQFEALPRLIKCLGGDKENGNWVIDLEATQEWGSDDHSTWWHSVRARPNFGTFEIRLLPSWPIASLPAALADLDRVVMTLFEIAPLCLGFENSEELVASRFWKEFARLPIGGRSILPMVYTEEMWNADVFG